jgi:uncharacterized protein YecA (UPF0149 family)
MQLAHEFIKLPYRFDVDRLREEILAFDESQWCPHPDGFEGNSSLPLVTVNGGINNKFIGVMQPTEALLSASYLQQVISSFGQVIGRSRLMRLAPGTKVPSHSDTNLHWYRRVRIHIPVITDDEVIFKCGSKSLNMKAGDAWIFDSWKYHEVHNNGQTNRVHLVIDTCGDSNFWDMVAHKGVAIDDLDRSEFSPDQVNYTEGKSVEILTEKNNGTFILHPGELDFISRELLENVHSVKGNDPNEVAKIESTVTQLCQDWRNLWYLHGENESGWKAFQAARSRAYAALNAIDSSLEIDNGTSANFALIYCLILPLINSEMAPTTQQTATTVQTKSVEQPQAADGSDPAVAPASGRNALCNCGSGKKYKHCHGQLR